MGKWNYHLHSNFSDGGKSPEQILNIAIEQEMTQIGIVDHFATRKLPLSRQVQNLKDYIQIFRELQEKYASASTKLFVGIEIDCSRDSERLESFWDFDLFNSLDYIMLEYISSNPNISRSLDEMVEKLCKNVSIPIGLAHTDLVWDFQLNTKRPTKKLHHLIRILKSEHIFVEFNQGELGRNGNGKGKYYFETWPSFIYETLHQEQIPITYGSDSHMMYRLDQTERAESVVDNYKLNLFQFNQL